MEGWVSLDLQGIHWDSAKMLTSIFLQGERKETEGAWGRIPTPHTHTHVKCLAWEWQLCVMMLLFLPGTMADIANQSQNSSDEIRQQGLLDSHPY